MKIIDYKKTVGDFKIQYLDDNEVIEGKINVDISEELSKYIIDHEVNEIFVFPVYDKNGNLKATPKIKILDKNIEYAYYKYPNIELKHLIKNDVYYFYEYVSSEWYVYGTCSNNLICGLKNGDKVQYNSFKKEFIEFYLKKEGFSTNVLICCVPSHNQSLINNSPIAKMIKEISERNLCLDGSQSLLRFITISEQKKIQREERTIGAHLKSIKVNPNVKGKDVILVDDLMTTGASIKACKKLLLDAGAKSVKCFLFGICNLHQEF